MGSVGSNVTGTTTTDPTTFLPDATPTLSEREQVKIEFYKTYDVMTGVRIAATLGGFFSLMVLLVVYKSRWFWGAYSTRHLSLTIGGYIFIYLLDAKRANNWKTRLWLRRQPRRSRKLKPKNAHSPPLSKRSPGYHLDQVVVREDRCALRYIDNLDYIYSFGLEHLATLSDL